MPTSKSTVTFSRQIDDMVFNMMLCGDPIGDTRPYLERKIIDDTEPPPAPVVTLDPDLREAIRQVLWQMRKYEDALIATGLTPKQFNLLSRLRGNRWKLWEAIPGILSDPEMEPGD